MSRGRCILPGALAVALAMLGGARTTAAQVPAGAGAPSIAVHLLGEAASGSVEFGQPFALEVVRRWPAAAVPEPWQDEALAPLVVSAPVVLRAEQGGEIVETRRYRAHAFRRGAVTLAPGFGVVIAAGQEPVRAAAETRVLLIDSALPDGDDGRPELPPAPPLHVVPARRLVAETLTLAALAAAAVWLLLAAHRLCRRRRATAPAPRARLLQQVEALARNTPTTRDAQRNEAVTATAILRAAEPLVPAAVARPAAPVLAALDAVKFAGRPLSAAERQALLAELRRFVAAVPETGAAVPIAAPPHPRTGAA